MSNGANWEMDELGLRKRTNNNGLSATLRTNHRLVSKDGICHVSGKRIPYKGKRYMADIYNTLLDLNWGYIIILFGLITLISWLLFGVIWYVIAIVHEDDTHRNATNKDDMYGDFVPCVSHVYDFYTSVLFSVETQNTIGYGLRTVSEQCAFAIIMVILQSCIGLALIILMTGVMATKFVDPKYRVKTLMFSRNAVICKRNGVNCFMFRIGDPRESHIVTTAVYATLIRSQETEDGELIPLCESAMELETESGENFVFLAVPATVTHKITRNSPLWNISAEQLRKEHFEIVIILQGVVEMTGRQLQARTSYIPSELLWGHKFVPLMGRDKNNGKFEIDFKDFNTTIPANMNDDRPPDYGVNRAFNTVGEERV